MIEAPPELEALIKGEADRTGLELLRDVPVELKCQTPDGRDPTFLIYWPLGQDRIHILVPRTHARGLA